MNSSLCTSSLIENIPHIELEDPLRNQMFPTGMGLNSLTVLTTHFVINLVNYTYSKLVEIRPMTLAPTNEHSGGTWRKTIMVKKPLMRLLLYMEKNLLLGKILMYGVTYFMCW